MMKSIGCFLLAAILELSGAYLTWQWWRNGKSVWLAALAGMVLVSYAIVNTFQAANFGRSYAAYGGVFIAMALLWGWLVEGSTPDRFDLAGALISLGGAAVILYAPR